MASVGISDSIKKVFKHFDEALMDTLVRTGYWPEDLNQTPQIEGIHTLKNKVGTLFKSLVWPSIAEKESVDLMFQVWPTLGCWEILLWRKSSTIVFMHDPVPLRKQIGFSFTAKLFAKIPFFTGKSKILTLSKDGLEATNKLFPKNIKLYAPHPIKTSVKHYPNSGLNISIIGQHKQARDIQLIEDLGAELRSKGFETKIWGRGWPVNLSNWEVNSRFLTEAELDEVIIDSRLVVLPYSFFFQSGIAIRALELGRISVAIDNSFMREIYGETPSNIVSGVSIENWANAVINSCKIQDEEISSIRQKYTAHVDSIWKQLLNSEIGTGSK